MKLIDKIGVAKDAIPSAAYRFDKCKAEAEKDGQITADEQKEIDRLGKEVAGLRAQLKQLETEQERLKTRWGNLGGPLEEFDGKLNTITLFGAAGHPRFKIGHLPQERASALSKAEAGDYETAVPELEKLLTKIDEPWAEYEVQLAAKGQYETQLGSVSSEMEPVRQSPYQATLLKDRIADVDTTLQAAEALAADLDYVGACRRMDEVLPYLTAAGEEAQRLEETAAELRKALDEMSATAEGYAASPFPEITERVSRVMASLATMRKALDDHQLLDAGKLEATLRPELQIIADEHGRLEAEERARVEQELREHQEWQAARPRFEEVEAKLQKLEEWKDPAAPAIRGLAGQVTQAAEAERWADAVTALPAAEQALVAPYEEYQVQLAASEVYRDAFPPLQQRAAAAQSNQYADDAARAALQEIGADLAWMEEQAAGRSYTAANGRLTDAAKRLDALEQALRELEIRARVAGEMGGASDAEIEAEVKRRLYYQERPPVDERIGKAETADLFDEAMKTRLGSLKAEVEGSYEDLTASRFEPALDRLRKVAGEMGGVEDELRKQQERSRLYTAQWAQIRNECAPLAKSRFTEIGSGAAKVSASLEEADKRALAHDYVGALDLTAPLRPEIARLQARSDEIGLLAAQAEPRRAALERELMAVREHEIKPLTAQRSDLLAKADETDGLLKEQKYAEALPALDKLRQLLTEYEKRAKVEAARAVYAGELAGKDIEGRLSRLPEPDYPEASEPADRARKLDAAHKALAEKEEFDQAKAGVLELNSALNELEREIEVIENSRKLYEQEIQIVDRTCEGLLDPLAAPARPSPKYDEALRKQEQLKTARAEMHKAAKERRYKKALELQNALRPLMEEVTQARLDCAPINRDKTISFIRREFLAFRSKLEVALLDAEKRFDKELDKKLSAPRAPAKWVSILGTTIGIADIFLNFLGPLTALVGKTSVTVFNYVVKFSVDGLDYLGDEKDKAIAVSLKTNFKEYVDQQIQGGVLMDGDAFVAAFERNRPDQFDEIGRHVSRDDESGGARILASLGVDQNNRTDSLSDQLSARLGTEIIQKL